MITTYYLDQDNITKFPNIKPYNKIKLNNIVVHICYNDIIRDKYAILPVFKDLTLLTGQRPQILKVKESIAAFKLRKNMEFAIKVTISKLFLKNFLYLIFLNLPKFNITNHNISLSKLDLFFLENYSSGSSFYFNFKQNNKISLQHINFFKSSLFLY